jgi:hypothetical protein
MSQKEDIYSLLFGSQTIETMGLKELKFPQESHARGKDALIATREELVSQEESLQHPESHQTILLDRLE